LETSGNLEYVGAVTDITAAKQAEEKIRLSEMELDRSWISRRSTSPF